MLGLKSTLITGAAGLLVAMTLAFLWKSEQVKSARLEGELSQTLVNTVTLKNAVEDQKSAFNKMASLVSSNDDRLDELMQERDNATAETARARSEIDMLRASEANRALQAPFGRGNFARERFTNSMRRISGTASGSGADSHDTDVARSGHPE